MKKFLAAIFVAVLSCSLLAVTAFAREDFFPGRDDQVMEEAIPGEGMLMITEPGSYVLTGKMTGTVYVDPGQGEVELILDGADINGGDGPAIMAVSGDALRINIPEGSINRIEDGEHNEEFPGALFSKIDTFFEGNGALYINGNSMNGIFVDHADLIFNGGSFAIKAPQFAIGAENMIFNSGSFSMQAPESFDPAGNTEFNGGRFEEVPMNSANQPAEGQNNNQGPQQPEQNNSQPEQNNDQGPQQPGNMQGGEQNITGTADSASEVVTGTMTNSAADLEADYDNATYITVTDDNSQIKITSSGTYVITGSSSDGNITVKKGTTGVVLVLEDLDLTSTTGATISINKEAEVKIIISGNVVLTDNEDPADEDSADADVADAFDGAAIKAKADSQVYITGDGTLVINGNAKNGVKGGDDSSIIFDGVTVNITAVNDGINSNYDVTLLSGNFTIAAGDDAIHADHILTIGDTDGTGPVINVTESVEGLEGTVINIYGGDISIVSSDDAINAANGDGVYEGVLDYSFNMMGGHVVINSKGDGVDSNGNINLIDGSMEIRSASGGGEAGIDYDGELYISEDFELNNQSGVAGPDNMGGQMPGGDQMSGNNQMPGNNQPNSSSQPAGR